MRFAWPNNSVNMKTGVQKLTFKIQTCADAKLVTIFSV